MTGADNKLGWVLDDILQTPGALHAILLSADGMPSAHSKNVRRDVGERMAAAMSGVQSLSRQAAEFCDAPDSPWEQTMIQFGAGYLFVIAAGRGSYLAVSASKEAVVEDVTYRMVKAIDRIGSEMEVPARTTGDLS